MTTVRNMEDFKPGKTYRQKFKWRVAILRLIGATMFVYATVLAILLILENYLVGILLIMIVVGFIGIKVGSLDGEWVEKK